MSISVKQSCLTSIFLFNRITTNRSQLSSITYAFSSQFFTALDQDIVNVESWMINNDTNVFKMKFIFIPINTSGHWSLCVVLNAGLILSRIDHDATTYPSSVCILFFDSLKLHKKDYIAKKVRSFLNTENIRLQYVEKVDPFDEATMPIFAF